MNAQPVDWQLAARLAPQLVRPGPTAGWADRVGLVDGLRAAALDAQPHVARVTHLDQKTEAEPATWAQVLVVDRATWTVANVRSFAALARQAEAAHAPGSSGDDRVTAAGARIKGAASASAAVELAGVLAVLSGSVLGQVDPWGGERPRLLLVAPNILTTERSMGVPPQEFRLWVALHEQTHVLQFVAAPWLAEHLAAHMAVLLSDLTSVSMRAVWDGTRRAVRERGWSPLDLLTADQRAAVEQVNAVMALLEGHADVSMDAVGTQVLPSLRTIRRRFTQRREAAAQATGLRRVVRSLLGVDIKMAQYSDGATFVRRVRRLVGVDGMNAVWTAPELLPTVAEIVDPESWVTRVHG